MPSHPWFKRWFGEHYKRLYPHRDLREAENQVAPLLGVLPVTPEWRILDIGCGSGRHLEVLRRRGRRGLAGLDLSPTLLRDARARDLPVLRADMRHLPFRRGGFDLVTSFFTSFGYFATFEEDVAALGQFVSVLRPGGFLFLDLPNAAFLLRNLVPRDVRMVDGAMLEQRRRLEEEPRWEPDPRDPHRRRPLPPGQVVIKDIEIRRPEGEAEHFQERVRLYSLAEMIGHAETLGLRQHATFGDEAGGAWDPERSPRMALLFRLGEAAGEGPWT